VKNAATAVAGSMLIGFATIKVFLIFAVLLGCIDFGLTVAPIMRSIRSWAEGMIRIRRVRIVTAIGSLTAAVYLFVATYSLERPVDSSEFELRGRAVFRGLAYLAHGSPTLDGRTSLFHSATPTTR
jgi:hypothetical protein